MKSRKKHSLKKNDKSIGSVTTVDFDVSKSSKFIADKPLEVIKKKNNIWGWIFLGTLIAITTGVLMGCFWYVSAFEQAASVSMGFLVTQVRKGLKTDVFEDKNKVNILILGLDEIKNQREGSKLTDTVMVVSIAESGKARLISIPRDLWIDSLKTKINALYYYGEASDQTTGEKFTADVVGDITGLIIDETVVLRLDTARAVIDAMNGVVIDIPRTFEDNQFPRDNVDITSKDPEVLYETVRFEKGAQVMDGKTALKYIRSRHSTDLEEGTDEARVKRQQLLVAAMVNRLKSKEVWLNPTIMGALYQVWKGQIQTSMSESMLVSLAKSLFDKQVNLQTIHIPIKEGEDSGLLVNPPIVKYKQWVYEPLDPTFEQLKEYISNQLN